MATIKSPVVGAANDTQRGEKTNEQNPKYNFLPARHKTMQRRHIKISCVYILMRIIMMHYLSTAHDSVDRPAYLSRLLAYPILGSHFKNTIFAPVLAMGPRPYASSISPRSALSLEMGSE